jgi:hypothetical protein
MIRKHQSRRFLVSVDVIVYVRTPQERGMMSLVIGLLGPHQHLNVYKCSDQYAIEEHAKM